MNRPHRGLAKKVLAVALAVSGILCGCQRDPGINNENNPITEINEKMRNGMIKDIYVDKARFDPGEKPVLTIEIQSEENAELELQVDVRHLTQSVFSKTSAITLNAGELFTTTLELELPMEDFMAYSVEAYLIRNGEKLDWDMTAAEVASDWSRFPRYGYLTKYGNQSDEQIRQTLERLNKHHITGLFYYDVLDSHQKPLAGTVDAPESGWKTLSNSYATYDTVSKLIDYGHEYNMNSYLYNLIFGAYDGFEADGVDPAWGLYKDKNHKNQDYHGDFSDSWETKRLYLFNPENIHWQDYYLQAAKDALEVYNYDGLQVDSLGSRGTLYDYNGNKVDLKLTYSSLLKRLTEELDTRVIFNPVSGYGQAEVMQNVDYDIIYEEVWPHDGGSYSSLKSSVDYVRNRMDDDKGIVIAAYMNYKKEGGAFNTASVLLTNATLMASGAAHLELGDTGMLKSEYYPGSSLRINEALEAALRNYYSFMVAYENYLRNPEFKENVIRTYVNDEKCALDSVVGKIWCFTKENENADQVIHFINLIGASSDEWVDNYGKQETPEMQTDLMVRQYVEKIPAHVYLASPDMNEGIMQELMFETGTDSQGTYITFQMPSLQYWNMVIIKQA